MLKVSIITVCYNSEKTISQCIESVINQDYPNVEYLIIDGGSNDKTVSEINNYKDRIKVFISEKDQGIYDAMNKALLRASGKIIGFLNSDDFYAGPSAVSNIVKAFEESKSKIVFGDLVIVDSSEPNKIKRLYSAANFKPWWLRFGVMPPHPATFIEREVFENFGLFKTDYQIAADYEFFVRVFWREKISYTYIPHILIKMRDGGISNRGIRSKWILNKEIVRGCLSNGLYTNMALLLFKLPFRILELLKKPDTD